MSLFDEMTVFASVVERGNFTRAADALGLSRSRVSEAVQSLETRLGVRLLDRSTRHVAMTEEGRLFYVRCQRALGEIDTGIAELQARRDEPSGRLRIGAPDVFADLYVVPVLAGFRAAFPLVTVELFAETRTVDLIGNQLDLAIRITRAPDPGLIVRRLGVSEPIVVAAPALLDRVPRPRRPEDLAGLPCVAFGALHWARAWPFAGAENETCPVPIDPAVTCSSTTTLRSVALAGLGFTVVPDWAVARDLAEGTLIRVLDGWSLPSSDIFAAYPSNRLITPKVRRFVDHLVPFVCDARFPKHSSRAPGK